MKGLTGIGCPVPLNRLANQESNFRYEPSFIEQHVATCVCVLRHWFAYAIHTLMVWYNLCMKRHRCGLVTSIL